MTATPEKAIPDFLPTLTEVVTLPPAAVAQAQAIEEPRPAAAAESQYSELDTGQLAERVLQQLDAALSDDLHTAVSTLVQEHLRALEPRLVEQIEQAVRQSLAQVLGRELAAWRGDPS